VDNLKKIVRRQLDHDGGFLSDLHPVLQRIYLTRQVSTRGELEKSLDHLIPPERLKGIDEASSLLADALRRNRRIVIVADFDADGATSCAVAMRALYSMGATDVRYLVPNRFEFGYGLTPEIVSLAAQQQPQVVITVDNGISSIEGVHEARRLGMDVLITDHHLPGHSLPDASVIVNPNQPGDSFPSKHLAGVGVIFYVMLALRARLRAGGWFKERNLPEPNLARLLDLVALGTVADVVPLDANNRILVAQGLQRINHGQCSPGIEAILRVAGRQTHRVTAVDLGYLVGPRLNAAGRLTDMSLGIECLISDDFKKAHEMALQLDALNRERRSIESTMQQQALTALTDIKLESDSLPRGLCLFHQSWHQGVIGIVAARIKERVHRPVIAFAPVDDTELKGSARSVPGLHIRDALDAIAAAHPDLLSKFGGHAMAAGLSISREKFDAFCEAFNTEVSRHLTEEDLQGTIISDGELMPNDVSLPVAELLRAGGPWGQGFPEPVFDGYFEVASQRVVGEKHLKLNLRLPGTTQVLDAIAFNSVEDGQAPNLENIRAAYKLDVNEYQGYRSLQLILEHLEPVRNQSFKQQALSQAE